MFFSSFFNIHFYSSFFLIFKRILFSWSFVIFFLLLYAVQFYAFSAIRFSFLYINFSIFTGKTYYFSLSLFLFLQFQNASIEHGRCAFFPNQEHYSLYILCRISLCHFRFSFLLFFFNYLRFTNPYFIELNF